MDRYCIGTYNSIQNADMSLVNAMSSLPTTQIVPIGKAAEILGVSIDTLRRWDRAGKITSVRPGGKDRYFNVAELEKINQSKPLSISEASKRLGISSSTLRRYEQRGVITPQRNDQGERVYDDDLIQNFSRNLIPKGGQEAEIKPEGTNYTPKSWQYPPVFIVTILLFTTILSTLYIQDRYQANRTRIETSASRVLGAKDQGGIIGFFAGIGQKVSDTNKKVFEQYKLVINTIQKTIVERTIVEKTTEIQKLVVNEKVIENLNAELVGGKKPGENEGDLAFFSSGGTINALRVSSLNLLSGSVKGGDGGVILDGSITVNDLASDAVTGIKILNDTIKTEDIAPGAIGSSELADGIITSSDIQGDTIDAGKLAGTLTFSDGDYLDLSAVSHDDTGSQGLRLPNASSATPVSPSSGEGYIAWDTAGNQIIVYSGSAWTTVSGGASTTLSATGGLEYVAGELSILTSCADGQLLEWTDAGGWACADDNTGGGGSTTVEEGDVSVDVTVTNFDFLANDFIVGETPEDEVNISIDYTNSKIVRSDQTQSITGAWSFASGEITGGVTPLRFEGTTDDNIYTQFTFTDPTTSSKTITFPNASIVVNAAADISGTTLASGVTGSSLTSVGTLSSLTVSGAIAANGGITFDATTDTVGAHTLSGTVNADQNIIENIGNTGTDFIVTTGALTLAGVLTANGGVSIADGQSFLASGNITLGNAATDQITLTGEIIGGATPVRFEGATDDNIYTQFTFTDPTSSTKTITFPNASIVVNAAADISGTTLASGVTGSSLTSVGTLSSLTVSGGVAANGGITFDAATDTIGAFTAGGTIDMGAQAITGTTGIINYTGFDVDASGNLDALGTITAGSGNEAITLVGGKIDADAITLATSGTTGSSSSRSGLQTASDGLTLLMGCIDGQLLEWTDAGGWACADDNTSAGAGISTVQENNSTITGTANTLDFLGADFDVTIPDGAPEADIAIDYANSEITRNNQNETIVGDWAFSFAAAEALDIASDLATAGTLNVISITGTPSATDGTIRGLTIINASSANANGIDAGLLIDNADDSVAVGTGISVTSSGGGAITTAIDLTSTAIGTGISMGANDIVGTTGIINYTGFDVDASGNLDALGTITAGSGNVQVTDATGKVQHDSIVDCTDGQILKWATAGGWACAEDATGAGAPDTEIFQDTTSVPTWPNPAADTTELWNDATRPNITVDSASNNVLVSVSISGTGVTTADTLKAARIVFNTAGTAVCGSTMVGGATNILFGGSTTDALGGRFSLNGTFVHNPGVAGNVSYTVCSSAVSGAVNSTIQSVYVSLVELGADLAENYYTSDDSIGPGDVVTIDSSFPAGVKKASTPYDAKALGVVSTAPGITLDDALGLGYGRAVPIALAGRVPVKVSTENGRVKVGDLLAPSSVPGVAMKATKAGQVIGQALQDFSYLDGTVGLVVAFVKTDYGQGAKISDILSGIEFTRETDLSKEVLAYFVSQKSLGFSELNLSEIVTDRLAAGMEVITPTLRVDEVFANKIYANEIEGLTFLANQIISEKFTQVQGVLDAENASESASLSSIDNDLTIDSLIANKGLTVFGLSKFMDGVTFSGAVTYLGDVFFERTPTFNKDTAGFAVVKEGSREVYVTFENEYAETPVVSASPVWDADKPTVDTVKQLGAYTLPKQDFIVASINSKGFTIILGDPAVTDLKFSWFALAVNGAKTVNGEPPVPSATPTPALIPTPTSTPTPTPSPSPVPTITSSASPTVTPTADFSTTTTPTATVESTSTP